MITDNRFGFFIQNNIYAFITFYVIFTYMITRRLKTELQKKLASNSSVALIGPRQVGKTTLAIEVAKNIPSVYLDLESRMDLQKVQDIEAFQLANEGKLIILDEVQRLPEVFAPIRGIIDRQRRKGIRSAQFLFLGSASIELLQQSSETLAGRITFMELFPVDITEYLGESYNINAQNDLWLKGGFPESLIAEEDQSLQWRFDFIKTYLERDIPLLGPRIPANTLERFWTMLAHNQGNPINASKLASNLDVSGTTIARYIDLLVDLLLIRKLPPYTTNVKKRLVKSPRIYVRDSGITHALLNIETINDLFGHPVVGKSWEGFVIENVISTLPQRVRYYYYRTSGGAEIDLILEFGINKLWAIEIKKGSNLTLGKGFYEACNTLKPERKFVIHSGADTFPMSEEISAISLSDFLELLLSL